LKALITAFDLALIAGALLALTVGLARRWAPWRARKPAGISGDWGALNRSLFSHSDILKRPQVGWAHLGVFWGVVLPLAVILLAQLGFTIPALPAGLLSLTQDLAGIALLTGILYLLVRRLRMADAPGPARTLLPMAMLLVILLTGFFAEGARLQILEASIFPWTSPVGWFFAKISPASPLFMQLMIRLHFFGVLLLIATIPFTFMRHAAAAPLNVFYRKKGPHAALTTPALENGEIGACTAHDLNWKQLLDAESCVACGRCDENCPAAISGKALSPRKIIRNIRDQLEAGNSARLDTAITAEEMWACTSCMACVEHCPVCIEPLDKIIDIRRHQVMGEARLPHEARAMIRDMDIYGDVQGKGAAHRADWAMNRGIPQLSDAATEAELLLWVGCSGAFHPRNQETTRAMAKILNAAGISFAILGVEEQCCGDPARRLGDEILFRKLAENNIRRFHQHNVQKIVTLCPHCLNTLKNEYPDLGCTIDVRHATELVTDLIREKRITLKYPVAGRITFHDACYLGRYNQVYAAPREICRAVPGAGLTEPERNRETGFCCGGGGGRMWLHENTGENINVVRAKELAETGADLIAAACPYCLVMMDDGIKALELEKTPKVADIIDIVADALG